MSQPTHPIQPLDIAQFPREMSEETQTWFIAREKLEPIPHPVEKPLSIYVSKRMKSPSIVPYMAR